jgi:serine/threonine-protein kinase
MASQELRCPCGHGWERPIPGPIPTDIRTICPVCTPGVQSADSPTVGEADREGPTLKPGDEVAGFEIIRPLNRGGMGVVYKARQTGLDRLVALKVIAPDRLGGADQAEYLERFRREARAAALLNHPNIVTVYATDLSGSRPYFAMEYVDGIDLYRLVERVGRIDVHESCEYIRQAATGLQHAYERGLVHRDIKPHNLMVTPSPLAAVAEGAARRAAVVKILDMGLARVDTPDQGLAEGLTQAEAFLGTPDYAAPEQAEDSRLADTRADLYSLGATWFYLLTGEVPFPGTSLMQKLKRQLTQPTPLVTDHRPDVPPPVAAMVRKLMEKDPAQRFQTPAELADAITDYLRDPTRIPDWMAPAGPTEPVVIPAHAGGVAALSLNSDGRLLLSGGDDEALRVWEAPELTPVRTVSGDTGPVCGVALTGKGRWGASCALRLLKDDMAVQLWDLEAGRERRRLRGRGENLTCVALTPDGRRVAAGDGKGVVYLWTLDPPGTPPLALVGHAGAVSAVAFAPDASVLFSGGLDGKLRQWDAETRRGVALVRGDVGPVRGVACARATGDVALAADRLALVQPDGTLRPLEGHTGGVLCVAFSADGKLVASGGADQSVRLYRVADGMEVAVFEGHAGPVRAVAVSPDRRFVYSGGADGTLRAWPVGLSALLPGSSVTKRGRAPAADPGTGSRPGRGVTPTGWRE